MEESTDSRGSGRTNEKSIAESFAGRTDQESVTETVFPAILGSFGHSFGEALAISRTFEFQRIFQEESFEGASRKAISVTSSGSSG